MKNQKMVWMVEKFKNCKCCSGRIKNYHDSKKEKPSTSSDI
jgi:hypothetical protein